MSSTRATERRAAMPQRGMILPALILLLTISTAAWLLGRLGRGAEAPARSLAAEQRSRQALMVARDALIGYAATYRGPEHPDADFAYLPCPDLDGDGSSETCGGQGQTSVGRLPYLTLNLPDLRDGWGECLWYAVAGTFKNNPKPQVLNWDSTGLFRILAADGAPIAQAGDAASLAAALIIAPGPPQSGQQRQPGGGRCGGDPEAGRIQDYVEALSALSGSGEIQVRIDFPEGNDRILALSGGDIVAHLKQRPSYASHLQTVFAAVASCLVQSGLPRPVNATALGEVELGLLPAAAALSGPCRSQSLRDATGNWLEMMRYARCTDGSACLSSSAGNCKAALIFGGERGPGQTPRSPEDKRNTDQYLEPDTLAAIAHRQIAALPDRIDLPAPAPRAVWSRDVALCLP